MIRALLAVFVFVCALATPGVGGAQLVDPPIVMRDPAAYAQTFADSMALSGVLPIRETFAQLIGAEATVSGDVEASLRVYEHPEMIKPARVSRVIEDVALADTFRVIYLYHYYGGNFWIFTRLEFVRVSPTEWTLSRLAFADRWPNIVLTTSPGFASAAPREIVGAPRNRR